LLVNCATNPIVVDAFNDSLTNRPTLGSGIAVAFTDEAPRELKSLVAAAPGDSLNIQIHSSNLQANKEPSEPNIVGNAGGKSVWWQWTAPRSENHHGWQQLRYIARRVHR
jgi:hypothetical protein